MDWTEMLVAAIGLVATALGSCFVRRYLIPWLQEKNLMDVATMVVDAVEALYGRFNGAAKWEEALEKMAEYGFSVNNSLVLDALMAAWQQLDLRQLAAGAKMPPEEKG